MPSFTTSAPSPLVPAPDYVDPQDPVRSFCSIAAWRTLSPQAQELIGAMAVEMVFAAFVHQDLCDEPLWFDEATRDAAAAREEFLVNALYKTVDQQMPELFGTDENPPTWPEEFRTDREIAEAAITGLRRIWAPASLLTEA